MENLYAFLLIPLCILSLAGSVMSIKLTKTEYPIRRKMGKLAGWGFLLAIGALISLTIFFNITIIGALFLQSNTQDIAAAACGIGIIISIIVATIITLVDKTPVRKDS